MSLAIHWFRRDLRLSDNSALLAASRAHAQILPVYILSRWKKQSLWTGPLRQQFLCNALSSLDHQLRSIGSKLTVRQGDALEELEKLLLETKACALYANRDPDPFGRLTEQRLAQLCQRLGVTLHLLKDVALHERDEVLTGAGSPFKVFTPYSRAWSKLPKPTPQAPPPAITSPEVPSLPLPTLETWELSPPRAQLPEATEAAARKRLDAFLESSIYRYAERRDLPGTPGTSRISQDLRFGLISIRTVYQAAEKRFEKATLEERRSIQTYLNELCWREFYFQVLWHAPHVLEHEFSEPFRGMPWEHHPEHFERWCFGQTGFPIVDAGIRELQATGFMHNRVRMIVAMFLTKDLHLDWRRGEQWFMQHLLDGEIASNNGGWQWSAGTGTDAAPYFRIQNPWTQSERFDPEALYIRRWVPELAAVPAERLHKAPNPGLRFAPGYPLPIVDHARERDRSLALYKAHLGRP
jgi:deoxyribodipyrimidine photo-lyase